MAWHIMVTDTVAIGRELPCSHRVGCDCVRCMCAPPPTTFLGESWNPPGLLWGVQARPAPLCETFPIPSGLLFSV